MNLARIHRAPALLAILLGLMVADARAQGAPPPLGPPPVPPANPQTPAKINLGKLLFWEEQLSLTGTVACGTCHRPDGGGTDPRSVLSGVASFHPGPDSLAGTDDDVRGSLGVAAHDGSGAYLPSAAFGFRPQVGGRKSPSAINAAYAPLLFWDGRAGPTFNDPVSGVALIQQGGALENQALPPTQDGSEMGHANSVVADLPLRLSGKRPLALAQDVPAELSTWINGRGFPALFQEVFGTTEITAARIALAIASYERTLNANQTPFDAEQGGTPSLTPQELQGRQVFNGNDCAACHAGPLLSDNQFHYIGVRPVNDDLGRFNQTGNDNDRGRFRTPSLRNVGLRDSFFHNGRFSTLEEVVDFYFRGGDFSAPNKDPRVRPRAITPQQRAALLAFLRRPLTDPRVSAEQAPFDRPTLYAETDRVPQLEGTGNTGSAGVPQLSALEPPLLGTTNFTVTVFQGLANAPLRLVVSRSDPGVQTSVPVGDFANLDGNLNAGGYTSLQLAIPDQPGLLGQTLWGRAYITDPGAPAGLAVTAAFRITVFGVSTLPDSVFASSFE